jgi:hypothetical protein
MQSESTIVPPTDAAPSMPGAFISAVYDSVTIYPSSPEEYVVSFEWSFAAMTGEGDAAALRPVHYTLIRSIAGVAAVLRHFTLVNIDGPVEVHLFPRASDLDFGLNIVAAPWTELAGANARTFQQLSRLPGTQFGQWRSGVTIPAVSNFSIPFPRNPITTSLNGAPLGAYEPALMFFLRNADSAPHPIADGNVSMMITLRLRVSGRGLLFYPS